MASDVEAPVAPNPKQLKGDLERKWTALGQGICGSLAIGLGIALFPIKPDEHQTRGIVTFDVVANGSFGIWCGLIFIVTAVTGLVRRRQKSMISTYLALSLASLFFSAAILTAVLFGIAATVDKEWHPRCPAADYSHCCMDISRCPGQPGGKPRHERDTWISNILSRTTARRATTPLSRTIGRPATNHPSWTTGRMATNHPAQTTERSVPTSLSRSTARRATTPPLRTPGRRNTATTSQITELVTSRIVTTERYHSEPEPEYNSDQYLRSEYNSYQDSEVPKYTSDQDVPKDPEYNYHYSYSWDHRHIRPTTPRPSMNYFSPECEEIRASKRRAVECVTKVAEVMAANQAVYGGLVVVSIMEIFVSLYASVAALIAICYRCTWCSCSSFLDCFRRRPREIVYVAYPLSQVANQPEAEPLVPNVNPLLAEDPQKATEHDALQPDLATP